MNDERLAELLERHFDRELTAEEKAELESMLLHEPAARDQFWIAAEWRALFHQWGEMEAGHAAAKQMERKVPGILPVRSAKVRLPASRRSPSRPRKAVPLPRPHWLRWTLAAAAILVFAFLVGPSWWHRPVATLVDTANARWMGSSANLRAGAILKPGTLVLEDGFAVIAFQHGARVVLEGPAELELLGENGAVLRSGRLRARVPENARGFTIQTPGFTVVDIGTEFGCSVSADGSGEVHVLAGAVNFSLAGSAETLRQMDAVQVASGRSSKGPARPSAFVSEEEIARRRLTESGDLLGAWRIASRELSRHPAMVAHYDFENANNGVAPNRSPNAAPGSGARIIGPQTAEGRVPGKAALAFTKPDDRLRVSVNRSFDALTLLAWIRPDETNERQYLVKSAGAFKVGDVDWYLYREGTMGFGVHAWLASDPSRGWAWVHSRTDALQPRQWMFVASVIDGAQGQVTHYVNGEPVGSGVLESRSPMRMGDIDVGAAIGAPPEFGGAFRGVIDEMAILATPLDGDEIRKAHMRGSAGQAANTGR